MRKILYLITIAGAIAVAGCKKNNPDKTNNGGSTDTVPSKHGTVLQLIQDSVYLYAKEDYLWFDQLPSYKTFNPRSFTGGDDKTALTNELNALAQYAVDPATNLRYEYYQYDPPGVAKYSFIDDGTETAALNGSKGDFGFDVQFRLQADLRIEYVYAGSPAALAGIKRGDQITSVNGSTNIAYDGPGYGTGTSANLDFLSNAIYKGKTIKMNLQRPDGSTYSADLTAATYNVNPILKDTVFNEGGGHLVGYLVFNSFTSDNTTAPLLDAAFAGFAAKGITDLVVDLRYNNGGYTSTAEHLDNLIVPPSKNGTLMYNSYFNSNLVNRNDPLLGNQWRSGTPDYNYGELSYTVADNAVKFAKNGTLNLGRVFFIITSQTASASELTINNLRPEMDVQMVGEQSYGKPVGFFDIDINKYILYTPEFSVKNSAGQGDYYQGFTPGSGVYTGYQDNDDPTTDFGDTSDVLLADCLRYINTGSYQPPKTNAVQSIVGNFKSRQLSVNRHAEILDPHRFTGMVMKNGFKLKK